MKYRSIFMRNALLALSFVAAITACNRPEENTPNVTGNVYVASEGAFGNNNASVVRYNPQDNTVSGDLFEAANGARLGGSLNAMTIVGNRAFLAVQTAGQANDKIEIVNLPDFRVVGTVFGEGNNKMVIPRQSAVVGTKLYVTNWGPYDSNFNNPNAFVLVINLTNNAIVKRIEVPNGADAILAIGNELWVAQSQGTQINIISAASDEIVGTVEVPRGPRALVVDRNEKVWALCNRGVSQLVRINPTNRSVEATITLEIPTGQSLGSALALNQSKDRFYYLTSEAWPSAVRVVHSVSIDGGASRVFVNQPSIYSLSTDPNDGTVYIGIAPNFSSNGTVLRYNAEGQLQGEFQSGIAPTSFGFVNR
jgi:hypothetical protein